MRPADPSSAEHPLDRGAVAERIEAAYDRAAAGLHRFFVVRLGGDTHGAADLMQQLWLAALKNARAVPENELEFWLRSVAWRLLASHWRSNGRMRVRHADGPTAHRIAAALAEQFGTRHLPPSLLEHDETRRLVMLALTDLPTDDQQLIIDHYFRGDEFASIAQRLNTTARAVEGRVYRARQALRQRLAVLARND